MNNLSKTILFETNGSGPIYGCSSLEGELDMTNGGWGAGTSSATAMSGQFFRETGWEVIKLPKTTRSITSAYVFYNAKRLKSLVIPAEVLVTISNSNALGNLAAGAKVYVPNDLVISYRKASYWSAIYTRILPIIDGPSVIYGDGTYSFIPNTPFDGFTDIEWTLEENDYLTLTTEQDGSATIVASGMTSETGVTVQLGYSFNYDNNMVTGTINIPVAYQEIIQFEDEEVKRICVNNWGGIYGSASKVPGVPGELTMEQAGSVTTIGTVLTGNNNYYNLDGDIRFLACISRNIDNLYHDQLNRYGKSDSNYFALPYFRVNPGDSITFSNGFIILYRKDFVSGDYWSGGSISSPRTIGIGNNLYLLRASILKSQQDSVYIKNNTTGEYLYKGANIE